ncbi:uncharacterized protein LOC122702169 isoform X2 [Cervus elaphus]|uniref:uncharacterized protein LOC122702169 isoform X2 n=1 Tax=Cervus elaphus TaxID=9860 RepID=UPI001CC2A116|nr:uncharacterized protein LOC122702169 isoform X2 [Cervus elaphus]
MVGAGPLSPPLGQPPRSVLVVSDVGGLCQPPARGSRHWSVQLSPESGRGTLLQVQGRPGDKPPAGLGSITPAMGAGSGIWRGWTLQSEVLMREAGICFLLCAWLGLGVPVLGDRGGEGWLRLWGVWVQSVAGSGLLVLVFRRPVGASASPGAHGQSPSPRGAQPRRGHLGAPSLRPALSEGVSARPSPSPGPAPRQPRWTCHGRCSQGQGLGLSPATITTSSGLSAAGLAQRQAREPAPGCSSPATSRWAASTSVSSGPAFAPWSCRPRRSSCLLTTSPSPSTTTSLGRSRSAWWIHSICPGDTLDPPSDLQSNVSSEHCVLTWSISPALEPLATLLSYELAFKRQEEAWEWARHKDHIVGVTWLKLEAAELDPGSAYEARLRVQMATLEGEVAEEEGYNGVWSDWSQPACFAAPLRRGARLDALPGESEGHSPGPSRRRSPGPCSGAGRQHPGRCVHLPPAEQPDLLTVQTVTQDEDSLVPGCAVPRPILPASVQRAQRGLPDLDRGLRSRPRGQPGPCWPPTRSPPGGPCPGGRCFAAL